MLQKFTRFKIIIKNIVGGQLAWASGPWIESYLTKRKLYLFRTRDRGVFEALVAAYHQLLNV